MRVEDLPVVGPVLGSGADDRVFDALLLAGPAVVVLVAVLGRSPITTAIAVAYLAAFVGNALHRVLER